MTLTYKEKELAERYAFITERPMYQQLKEISRHGCTNTYEHSVRVAYAASRLAARMGVDPESAAIVGLLHDFCLVDYRNKKKAAEARPDGRWYCFYHPEEALMNAAKILKLNNEEKKAILSHMFPLALHLPTSRLALILTLADKQVATAEGINSAADTCLRAGYKAGRKAKRYVKKRIGEHSAERS